MKIYRVGGAVRDRLLGLPVTDQDWVVVGGSAEQLTALGFRPVGKDFPVFLHPETHEEYALARTERKTGPGYRGFSINASAAVTLEEDLARRDLTINAIAEDESGTLIDPFNGRADLENGVLRHVSPAFTEDPLRVLRVARFAARLRFTLADETLALMQSMSDSGELLTLAPERVWTETERALLSSAPVLYFETLRRCGALRQVFPEIDALFGVPQPADYHPEIDTGVHTLMVLEQAVAATDDTQIRFAALVHDLGKGATPESEWPAHRGHEQRSVELVNALCDRLRVPGRFRELAILVARYHLDCHRIREMKPATVLARLETLDAFRRPERFEQFLIACEADARGRKGMENRNYPEAGVFRRARTAAALIDAAPLLQDGFADQALAAELRRRRCEAVQQVMEADSA